jgi:hypothetical protein
MYVNSTIIQIFKKNLRQQPKEKTKKRSVERLGFSFFGSDKNYWTKV